MKAIVLTFDRNAHFAELTYKMYMHLWPDCPFTFHIPWNKQKHPYLIDKPNIELIQSQKSIGLTAQALIEDCDDSEWVYWCIDDRFPVTLDTLRMEGLYNNLHLCSNYDFVKPFWVDETKVYKHPKPLKKVNIFPQESPFVVQNSLYHIAFWHHHFVRAKVLKLLFREDSYDIDFYQDLIKYDNILQPFKGLFTQYGHRAIDFLEPIIDGKTTNSGFKYISEMNLTIL